MLTLAESAQRVLPASPLIFGIVAFGALALLLYVTLRQDVDK